MLKVTIPNLQDPQLYQVLRQLSTLAIQMGDLFTSGASFPTTGKRKFHWHTTNKQLYFYTGDSTVGASGWIVLG